MGTPAKSMNVIQAKVEDLNFHVVAWLCAWIVF